MSNQSNKKYFWLKLKEDFFTQPQIKKLRKIAGGDTYTIILQKLMLLSIKSDGLIQFQGLEETIAEEIALICDEEVENVKITLSFMKSYGLIENLSDQDFIIPSVINLIGSETSAAERMRKHREKTSKSVTLLQSCYTEIELDKEIRDTSKKEISKDISKNDFFGENNTKEIKPKTDKKNNLVSNDIKTIQDYFTEVTGLSASNAQPIIDGFTKILKQYTVDDVKTVIDWLHNDDFRRSNGHCTLSVISKPTKFFEKLDIANSVKHQKESVSYAPEGMKFLTFNQFAGKTEEQITEMIEADKIERKQAIADGFGCYLSDEPDYQSWYELAKKDFNAI